MNWNIDSWKSFEAKQMPTYKDKSKLETVVRELSKYPPLIFAGTKGKSFLLTGW